MAHERISTAPLSPARLTLCVALGIWLGGLALACSLGLLAWLWPQPLLAVATVPAAVSTQAAPAAPADAQQAMFERYQQRLQAPPAAPNQPSAPGAGKLNDPKCQFWLEQQRTAATEKSQALVREFCH
ncbi:hypothetical protein [Pseudomonas cremoricolorata]|uniref:Lipoprotein n=1 Tax=Pseudomonas cremoricolorata TaxID=157783 RepID=A0A089WQQ5_9PSED|nr:hypothetical protein [Pseudomonas cremoricolorata]AIR91620.1 hypothetical protein LK03_21230 [Pseudomonas cremoricolorata]